MPQPQNSAQRFRRQNRVNQTQVYRRKRRNNRKKQRMNLGNNNSLAKVQNSLNSRTKRTPLPKQIASLFDSMYARCRLDPFNASGSNGIPDSTSNRKIVYDHRAFTTINILGTTTLDVLILPTLTFGAAIRCSTPNAVSIFGNGGSSGSNLNSTSFFPICIPPEYDALAKASYGPLSAKENPFQSGYFRVVTVGYKITYTGKPTEASGSVMVTSCPVSLTPDPVIDVEPADVIIWPTFNSASLGYTLNNITANMVDPTLLNNATQETLLVRPDQGVKGVLKTNNSALVSKPWFTQPVLPYYTFDDSGTTKSAALFGRTAITNGYTGFLYGYDGRFNPTIATYNGLSAGTSLLVEVITCVEYYPEPQSTYSKLAKANTKSSEQTINLVEKVLADAPAATTFNSPSLYSKFLSTVNVISKRTAPLLGPYSFIANAVSDISGDLANLNL